MLCSLLYKHHFILFSQQSYEVGLLLSIFKGKKIRHKVVKEFVQVTAIKWWLQGLNSGNLTPESAGLISAPF